MSRYVVDASVAIKWFLPEIHSKAALRLRSSRYRLHVPALMTLELGNVLVKRIRRGQLTRAEGDVVLKELTQLPLQRHADDRLFPPPINSRWTRNEVCTIVSILPWLKQSME